MTLSPRSAVLYSASLAGLLLLGACGKNQPAPPPSTPAAARTVAAPAVVAPAAASTAAMAPVTSSTAANAATAAATPASAPLSVAKLTLGNAVNAEHQVTRASNSFPSNEKTIYASVATEGHSSGATLNAKWSYLEGQGQLVSSISQSIATDGPAITTFKVQNPDLWPEGKYQVEISLDGKAVTKQGFEIKKR